MSYAKLHAEILDSSLWSQPDHIRIVWITMLAMSDQDGLVAASMSGLARRARVSVPQCEDAIRCFLGPDPESRDRTSGVRIQETVGGWLLINYERYRDKNSVEDRKAKNAARQKRWRDRQMDDGVTHRNAVSRDVTRITHSGSGSDQTQSTEARSARTSPSAPRCPDGVSEQTWEDYRKTRKKPITTTGLARLASEAAKAGWTLEEALVECCARAWQGFKAEWVAKRSPSGRPMLPPVPIQNAPLPPEIRMKLLGPTMHDEDNPNCECDSKADCRARARKRRIN